MHIAWFGPFWWPEANTSPEQAWRSNLTSDLKFVPQVVYDATLSMPVWASVLSLLKAKKERSSFKRLRSSLQTD